MEGLQAGDILKEAAQNVITSGMLPGQGTTAGVQAMGSAIVPDMGQLAASNGGGAGPSPSAPQPVGSGSLGGAMNQVPSGTQAPMP